MRSSCERPTVSIRTALVAAALALALGLTPAPALAAGKRHARAAAAVPTQVTLTGPSTPVRYATAVTLHARLSEADPNIYRAPKLDPILDHWGSPPMAQEIAKRMCWRDLRLAALKAHKRTQPAK